ncbi:MAG TPA: type I restriction enzyme HsdR N-terminal domain-containing protein [Parafilimonas sp.]|nr:type I restriction enzyme HsdR N-terminal domain-containing protein [Parafilimonas sp.]
MLKIVYPSYNFRIKKTLGKEFIFDEVRRRWVTLTPEEWVRQNFLQYILRVKNYPGALLSVEKLVNVGELRKRCDIVVYKDSRPWMIVECKEMNVDLNLPVLEQILRYNIGHDVQYLVITNGNNTLAFQLTADSFFEIDELPSF